ncbi:hypothetical protein T09_11995 [Trichinella sp. T9]|nr:hypothetical protein T09_11995 [Trichinella sp. T9]
MRPIHKLLPTYWWVTTHILRTTGLVLLQTGCLNYDMGNVICIIERYSLKFPSLVQYFLVLGNSIFLHFWSISNKLKKVV